jgi:hypothetical protein
MLWIQATFLEHSRSVEQDRAYGFGCERPRKELSLSDGDVTAACPAIGGRSPRVYASAMPGIGETPSCSFDPMRPVRCP